MISLTISFLNLDLGFRAPSRWKSIGPESLGPRTRFSSCPGPGHIPPISFSTDQLCRHIYIYISKNAYIGRLSNDSANIRSTCLMSLDLQFRAPGPLESKDSLGPRILFTCYPGPVNIPIPCPPTCSKQIAEMQINNIYVYICICL